MKRFDWPWGIEGTVVSSPLYSCRLFVIKQGEETPMVYHKTRDKTIFVLQGIVELNIEGTKRILEEGQRYHVRPKIKHQMLAYQGDATVIDVGTKFEDSDVVKV